jgi:hypothetical protein
MSRQVTAVYAEESTVARFDIDAQATVHDLKQRSCAELANQGRLRYGLTNGFPYGNITSIVLSSGTRPNLYHLYLSLKFIQVPMANSTSPHPQQLVQSANQTKSF